MVPGGAHCCSLHLGYAAAGVERWHPAATGAIMTCFHAFFHCGPPLGAHRPSRTSAGLGLLLLLCLVTPFGRVNANPLFAPNVDYPAAAFPSSVAIGDLDHDGNPDLVVGGTPNTLSVLLGYGDGTFRAKVDYHTLAGVSSVAIGDLDGDGNLDLVASNGNATFPSVSVLLGNGDGTFRVAVNYETGAFPTFVAIGDLDGDGKPDLAVAAPGYVSTGPLVSVLLGNGDGTFAAKVDYRTGPGPNSVAIGDLNGDGKPDLAVANRGSNTVSVLLGNGDGTFTAKVDYGTGGDPHSVAIGDLNGDGKPDLAVASSGSSTVSVLLGKGDGTFAAKADYATWCCATSVAIGDLNGDGWPDLVAADTSQPNYFVSVLLGYGNGTFMPRADYTTGTEPDFVAIADLNHDGRLDLAVADYGGASVSVLLSIAPTTAVPPAALPARFALMLAGPNPARSAVSLVAALPRAASVEVGVYSVQGGLVRRLLAGASLPAGIHPLVWDGRDESGARAPRGVYFARMRADGVVRGRTSIVLL